MSFSPEKEGSPVLACALRIGACSMAGVCRSRYYEEAGAPVNLFAKNWFGN
jgi:hypothetical protein